jgi:Polysaccharide pyruvyl transferase
MRSTPETYVNLRGYKDTIGMKYGLLKYDGEGNLGDEIQSLAIKRFLPRVDAYFDRNTLSESSIIERHLLFMNGWFSRTPERCLPAPANIVPAFIGFHITNSHNAQNILLNGQRLKYLRKQGTIGARDRGTAKMLTDAGIESFVSKCPTLTFEQRKISPLNGKVILVDINPIYVPEALAKNAIRIKQEVSYIFSSAAKYQLAMELLEFYRDNARLIVTTRLHCALPCLALGIPVVFFGRSEDYRLALLQDVGLNINPLLKLKKRGIRSYTTNYYYRHKMRDIDWNPKPLNVDEHKQKLETLIKEKIDTSR